MRKTIKLFVLLSAILLGRADLWAQTDYLTVYSVSVGQIIDSGSVTLPDGSSVSVTKVGNGSANPGNNAFRADFGADSTNIFGGYFDGVDNANANNLGDASSIGITMAGYQGSKVAGLFTRIVSNRGVVDNGVNTDYRNAIGFYIHTSTPQVLGNFLMLDFDGTAGDNREWASSFGYKYSGGTYTSVRPSYRLSNNTVVARLDSIVVNSTWQTMVQGYTNGTVNVPRGYLVRKTGTVDDIDPDDTSAQVVINYDTARTTDVFFLWGIADAVVAGGQQNSGLSPLVFKYNFDFGDAPGYNTLLTDDGARHLWTNVSTNLRLGSTVNREADGNESSPTASYDADDDGRLDDTLSFHILAGSTQVHYDSFKYSVAYVNNSGKKGFIGAWLDWNGDGAFTADEGLTGTTGAASTSGTYTFKWTNQTLKRKTTAVSRSFVRIRYTTDSLSAGDFKGVKSDGEVEDYQIAISNFIQALPVKVTSFEVNARKNEVACNWEVVNQKDVEQYAVLQSDNGADYQELGRVKANTAQASSYQYTGTAAHAPATWYKLAIYEKNGGISYSAVRRINTASADQPVSIYPNPAKDKINMAMNAGSGTAYIFNMAGQLMRSIPWKTGINTVDVSGFASGLYILVTHDETAMTAPVHTRFEVNQEQ